jgi:hypothetical protein
VADADGLGGAQVVLCDLRHEETAPAHPATQIVDRAEGSPLPGSRVAT